MMDKSQVRQKKYQHAPTSIILQRLALVRAMLELRR